MNIPDDTHRLDWLDNQLVEVFISQYGGTYMVTQPIRSFIDEMSDVFQGQSDEERMDWLEKQLVEVWYDVGYPRGGFVISHKGDVEDEPSLRSEIDKGTETT